jgi:hypothetical protein
MIDRLDSDIVRSSFKETVKALGCLGAVLDMVELKELQGRIKEANIIIHKAYRKFREDWGFERK